MAKKRYDFITIGGAVRDIMFYVDKNEAVKQGSLLCFKLGEKIRAEDINLNLGGGAANTSVALSRLGFKVATAMRLGSDDDGEAVMKKLYKEKVDTRFVQTDEKEATGFSVIILPQVKAKERQYIAFLHRGANDNLELVSWYKRLVKPRWIFATSLPEKGWQKIMDSVEQVIKKRKSKFAWNPGNQQLEQAKAMKKYLPLVEVLILNKREASKLYAGIKGRRVGNIKVLLSALHKMGPKIVAITSGGHGADAYDGKEYYYQKALSKKVVDTTGAGDAFGTGFVAGLRLYNYDMVQALYLGAKNSASVIVKPGAQNGLLTLKDIL